MTTIRLNLRDPRIFVVGATSHALYAYVTKQKKHITITDKYISVQKGFSEFMVVDIIGNHYKVPHSLWYWKWDANERWSKLRQGDEFYCSYYGWRIPILGIFPNIFSVA
jgi:hypothetical protein